jgi:hypothetical protein
LMIDTGVHLPMRKQTTHAEPLEKGALEALLEVYRQRYEHVRHVQQMRATHFNLYLLVMAAGVGALVNLYPAKQTTGEILWVATVAIGLAIWATGILTMMRSERWGGHIIHDLRVVRQIHNLLAIEYVAIRNTLPERSELLASIEFDRPFWSRNRSIETPVSMLGALLGIAIIAVALPFLVWAQFAVGAIMFLFTIWQWRAEVANLKKRHANCCLRPSEPAGS